MKLKTLLPIATITSVVGIVTPLVTSCGGYKEYKIPNKDNIKDYEFVEPKGGTMNAESKTATKIYFDDVKKNKKIFVDDYIKCFYDVDTSPYDEWLGVGKINSNEGRISTIDRYVYKDKDADGNKIDETYTHELKNVQWVVNYVLDVRLDSQWNITPVSKTVDELKKDHEWEYVLTSKVYNPHTKKYDKNMWTYNSNSNDDRLKEVEDILMIYSQDMPSYYLSKTTLPL